MLEKYHQVLFHYKYMLCLYLSENFLIVDQAYKTLYNIDLSYYLSPVSIEQEAKWLTSKYINYCIYVAEKWKEI